METCRALPMRGFLYNYRVSSVQVPIGHHQLKKQGHAIMNTLVMIEHQEENMMAIFKWSQGVKLESKKMGK